jgi:hypothetical protein
MMGCYEHSHEPLISIKGREFHSLLNDYQLLKKDLAAFCQTFIKGRVVSNIGT